jgi:hypothetical protein
MRLTVAEGIVDKRAVLDAPDAGTADVGAADDLGANGETGLAVCAEAVAAKLKLAETSVASPIWRTLNIMTFTDDVDERCCDCSSDLRRCSLRW